MKMCVILVVNKLSFVSGEGDRWGRVAKWRGAKLVLKKGKSFLGCLGSRGEGHASAPQFVWHTSSM